MTGLMFWILVLLILHRSAYGLLPLVELDSVCLIYIFHKDCRA